MILDMWIFLRRNEQKRPDQASGGFGRGYGLYLADAGRVAFTAVIAFCLLTAIAETTYPGLVTNWVSPGKLIGLAVLTGLMALWPAERTSSSRGRRSWIMPLIWSVLLGGGAFLAAWSYFASMATDRLWLSLTSGAVVGITAWLLSSDYRKRK